MSEKKVFLGRKGLVIGPISEDELTKMKLTGEIEKYSYVWNAKSSKWEALDPLPPVPGSEKHAEETDAAWVSTEAICHNYKQLVSGKLSGVSEVGCNLETVDGSDSPRLGLNSDLVLNVLDPKKNKGVNVKASLSDVTRTGNGWIYHLRWAHRPVLSLLFALLLLGMQFWSSSSQAEVPEEVEVEKFKENYWAGGNDTELGVVQNRYYTKKNHVEISLSGGNLNGDPFLSNRSYGGTIGYHISEFFSVHGLAWWNSAVGSSALSALQAQTNTTANTNAAKSYFGAEARGSLLYGKLSLIGKAILYFDAYFSAGLGSIDTESGRNIAVSAGLGQQIYLSRRFALDIDFKFLWYREKILGKGASNLGQDLGTQSNLSNLIMLGISYFL